MFLTFLMSSLELHTDRHFIIDTAGICYYQSMPLSEEIAEVIEMQIITGESRIGDRLPTDINLATAYTVTRGANNILQENDWVDFCFHPLGYLKYPEFYRSCVSTYLKGHKTRCSVLAYASQNIKYVQTFVFK